MRGASAAAKIAAILECEPPVTVTLKPAEPVYHDPVWLVQRAWSVYRLPRLQELIRLTISDLHTLPLPDGLGAASESAGSDVDPVAEALRACCEELRDASGMLGAEADRAQHCREVRMAQHSTAWADTFEQALLQYRQAATRSLEVAFR